MLTSFLLSPCPAPPGIMLLAPISVRSSGNSFDIGTGDKKGQSVTGRCTHVKPSWTAGLLNGLARLRMSTSASLSTLNPKPSNMLEAADQQHAAAPVNRLCSSALGLRFCRFLPELLEARFRSLSGMSMYLKSYIRASRFCVRCGCGLSCSWIVRQGVLLSFNEAQKDALPPQRSKASEHDRTAARLAELQSKSWLWLGTSRQGPGSGGSGLYTTSPGKGHHITVRSTLDMEPRMVAGAELWCWLRPPIP